MIIRRMMPLIAGLALLLAVTFAQIKDTTGNPVRVALVKMPYVGERNVPELSGGPDCLWARGLRQLPGDNSERHAGWDACGHRLRPVPHADASQSRSGAASSNAVHCRDLCARHRPARTGTPRPLRDSTAYFRGRSYTFVESARRDEKALRRHGCHLHPRGYGWARSARSTRPPPDGPRWTD